MADNLSTSRSFSPSALSKTGDNKEECYDKVEDSVNLQHLMKLMTVFQAADENGSDGLDLEEFQHAFKEILGSNKSQQQLASMFMKVDTNCDGTVDWDEFCTYMLLEYQEKNSMNRSELEVPYPGHIKRVNNSNSDNSDGKFITCSKDGIIVVWDSSMNHQKTYSVEPSRSKQLWVIDAYYMQNVSKVVTTTTDGELNFYEMGAQNCEKHYMITGFRHNPVAIDYWCNSINGNLGVLVIGDTDGGVGTVSFTNMQNVMFGLSNTSKQGEKKSKITAVPPTVTNAMCHKFNWNDLLLGKYEDVTVQYSPELHKDWTRKVQYSHKLNCFISCSTDPSTSVILCDLDRRRTPQIFKVNKGVNSFEYSQPWNVIATGGLDRMLRIWNPYVTASPTASLRGHESAILHVAISNSDGHIISISKDNNLRVWDIQSHACIQNVNCSKLCKEQPSQAPTVLFVMEKKSILLWGAYNIMTLENTAKAPSNSLDCATHNKPLCCALYNQNFNQVVCGCMGSFVSVWDVDTGEKIIQFSNVQGGGEITAMSFDPSGRRLITGGRNGKINIWNFNNGACLSQLNLYDTSEVTSIQVLGEKIITVGWSRKFGLFRDTKEAHNSVHHFWGIGVHQEDVLCSALSSTSRIFVSGSYKGEIFVWNIDSEKIIRKLYSSDTNKKVTFDNQFTEENRSKVTKLCQRRLSKWDRFENELSSPVFMNKDYNISVEKLLILKTRPANDVVGILVSAGAQGLIQFWNINGGGLTAIYSVFKNTSQETVYCLATNSDESILYTGDSLGYISLWDIREYGFQKAKENNFTAPPCIKSFRCHMKAIVSLEHMNDKELLLTASIDCKVRLWTDEGRFIGTFGEKTAWKLSYPVKLNNLSKKIPPEIQRYGSEATINAIVGPVTPKWRIYKNLVKAKGVWKVVGKKRIAERFIEVLDKLAIENNDSSNSVTEIDTSSILGKFYQPKKRREREVAITPSNNDMNTSNIYHRLITPTIEEPEFEPTDVNLIVNDGTTRDISSGSRGENKNKKQETLLGVALNLSELKI